MEVRQRIHECFFLVNQTEDLFRCFQCDLASIRAIHLITVKLGRVVAGRDHDACRAVQMTHCIGKHGGGHQVLIEIDADAHACENRSRELGKISGVNPAVA